MDYINILSYFQAVTARGGRFLEAPVIGSKQPAACGNLLILAAGDRSLYDDCYSCFEAMGKRTFYLGGFDFKQGGMLHFIGGYFLRPKKKKLCVSGYMTFPKVIVVEMAVSAKSNLILA